MVWIMPSSKKSKEDSSRSNDRHPSKSSSNSKSKSSSSVKKNDKSIKGLVPVSKIYTKPGNIVNQLCQFHGGIGSQYNVRKFGDIFIPQRLKNYYIFAMEHVFVRRVTALEWHPSKNILIAGSKGGEIIGIQVADDKVTHLGFCEGTGPGGSILSIAFNPFGTTETLIASLDGTIKSYPDYSYKSEFMKTHLSTDTIQYWYCSVNISPDSGMALAGDSRGTVVLLDKDYKEISSMKLHKNKVNTIDFNSRNYNIFATASTDHVAKIWDIRKLKENIPLHEFPHSYGVNCAYFSKTDSARLLTCDQNSELRVYSAPSWALERLVPHPHRQFQHLTAIKASWHPSLDLIVVGRYPDPNFPTSGSDDLKTIDIFSADSGEMTAQLYSSLSKGISSLNVFNHSGDYLSSGMGLYLPFWKYRLPSDKSKFTDIEDEADGDEDGPSLPPKRPRGKLDGKKAGKNKESEGKRKKGMS